MLRRTKRILSDDVTNNGKISRPSWRKSSLKKNDKTWTRVARNALRASNARGRSWDHDYSRKLAARTNEKKVIRIWREPRDRKNRSSKFHSSAPATQESGLEDVSRNPEPPLPLSLLQSLEYGIVRWKMSTRWTANPRLFSSPSAWKRIKRRDILSNRRGTSPRNSKREFEFATSGRYKTRGSFRDVQLLQLHPWLHRGHLSTAELAEIRVQPRQGAEGRQRGRQEPEEPA